MGFVTQLVCRVAFRSVYPGDASSIGLIAPAVVMTGSGATQTWGQLDERSNRLANFWRVHGLVVGDHVALLMDFNVFPSVPF